MVRILSTLLASAALLATAVSAAPRVDAGVHRNLRKQGSVDLIVTMKEGTEQVLNNLNENEFATRGQLIANMVESLEAHATETQQNVLSVLNQEATQYAKTQSYWISNQIYIEGASAELIEKLAQMPEISEIREQLVLELFEPIVPVPESNSTVPLENQWGVEKVGAPLVWEKGNTGEGVVVGIIDTGVRGTHEILKDNFLGEFGWFDPEKKSKTPNDGNGHGSHVAGTIAGANGYGVAPGAKWMACRGCRTSSCPESDLLACGEFMTCPTDTDGKNKDCSKAPRLVSNSWGGGQGSTFYKATVDAWQKADIIPIFAQGNSGPNCKTANSPGDFANVIGVGATDINDGLASFSSKGPSVAGLLKPDISAPGAQVRSSWRTDDKSYNTISGTSMACPHVSGVAALVLSAKPTTKYEDLKKLLTSNTDTQLKATGRNCGETPDGTFPNNNYGYGRINAFKAIYN